MAIGMISGIGAAVTCLNKLSSALSGAQNEPGDFQQCLQAAGKKLQEAARQTKGEDARQLDDLAAKLLLTADGGLAGQQQQRALAAYLKQA